MAEHHHDEADSLVDKISEKIRGRGDDSSSDSDDDGPGAAASEVKNKVFRLFGRERPVHTVLGGGKPADLLLWRDKKISAGALGVATVIWILFELVQYHLLTLVCHILILALAILFLWSNANSFINKRPPPIPDVSIPEKPVLEFASVLTVEINRSFALLREIISGRDLKKFLMAITGFWVLSVLGSWCNFLTLFYIVFVLLHTVPVLYDKHQDKVDPLAEKASIELKKHYAVLDSKVLSKIPRGPLKDKKA
ncbi:hypothetical protein MLD38_038624 [Melastoma candidum]|uniref:Uncharacterized protein n=1 Tax=Melastoma candidum TaxID=119954 RepID=A0ACB9KZH3_9MYRT|nr:hypothetical protein MLD38_038624 [Melastoma candidum]